MPCSRFEIATLEGYGARNMSDAPITPQSICGKCIERNEKTAFQAIAKEEQ
jgi:hypothetical protein